MTRRVSIPLPFALFSGSVTMQYYLGSSDNFFHGKFVTTKDTDDLAEFYQAEDLLRIIAVFTFTFNLFMNKVVPDGESATEETALISLDETHFNVKHLGMEVSFEIIEKEEEIDGETKLTSFKRHERFIDWVPLLNDFGIKKMLWDQTWVYGFDRREDGTVEVYHHGEKFQGPWPIRLIVFFHQYYVLWACEKYINGQAFGTEDLDKQQEELACMPLHVFKEFVGKLRNEKKKSLEALKNDPNPDPKAIAKAEETLDQLEALSQRKTSSISVVKRSNASGSVAGPMSVKVVAGDATTEQVLTEAMTDTKGNKDKAVNAAVMDVVQHPELEFKQRSKKQKSASKGESQASPKAEAA